MQMKFTLPAVEQSKEPVYRVIAVNTVGLHSKPAITAK
jgi:hypothetical protein